MDARLRTGLFNNLVMTGRAEAIKKCEVGAARSRSLRPGRWNGRSFDVLQSELDLGGFFQTAHRNMLVRIG